MTDTRESATRGSYNSFRLSEWRLQKAQERLESIRRSQAGDSMTIDRELVDELIDLLEKLP